MKTRTTIEVEATCENYEHLCHDSNHLSSNGSLVLIVIGLFLAAIVAAIGSLAD